MAKNNSKQNISKEAPLFDQHFMTDKTLLKKIASYCEDSTITEIGVGKGALTKELLKKANVTGIEIDSKLTTYLEEKFHGQIANGTFVLKKGSVLDMKLSGTIFSNLPYGISETFFYQFIRSKSTKAYLVTGSSFYKKLLSNTKLGIFTKELCDIRHICNIPPTAFTPSPKVSSTFFLLTVKEEIGFIGEILKQTDKKIQNAILTAITKKGKTKNQAKTFLETHLLKEEDETARTLSLVLSKGILSLSNTEFLRVYSFLKKIDESL